MIDILLSTYNGERFLREQVDSILGQSHRGFRLLVRDDGSEDATRAIINECIKIDNRVFWATDDLGNLGARRSFMRLLERVESDYFMLADQDDVWLPDKIEITLHRMRELENEAGEKMPLLVFTDLTVVDEELKKINTSLWHYQRLDPDISLDWKRLLAQNVVTGCTILANREAAHAALPFSLPEMMHDHWIAANTARGGKIGYVAEKTVLYRQHGDNVEGGRSFGPAYAAVKLSRLPNRVGFYRRAAEHFGDVTARELIFLKTRENLRRLKA